MNWQHGEKNTAPWVDRRKALRVTQNAFKLSAVFHVSSMKTHLNPLIKMRCTTCTQMNETATNDIIQRGQIGQQMFKGFVTESLTEEKKLVWDKMKKILRTFKRVNAMEKNLIEDKVVKIKEERGLLQRVIVISRSRPELDLKECIGTDESGVVPRSLFASDGSLLLAYDKASLLHYLEKLDTTQQVQADNKLTHLITSNENTVTAGIHSIGTYTSRSNRWVITISSDHHWWNGCGKFSYQSGKNKNMLRLCKYLSPDNL